MTASRSTGLVLRRNGLGHRYAKSGTSFAIPVTDLDTPERFRQPLVTCHLAGVSVISNRYNKLLELPVTRTKQTIAPHSSRYKTPLFSTPFAEPECGPFAFVGPDRRYPTEALRSTPLAVLNVAAAKGTREILIANEMHSPQGATNSKRATYDFLIANEFRFANRSRFNHV